MKIDEKATVPLNWVITLCVSTISVSIFAVSWVFAVNYRLSRIEEKLGIPPLTTASQIIKEASAGMREQKDAHGK